MVRIACAIDASARAACPDRRKSHANEFPVLWCAFCTTSRVPVRDGRRERLRDDLSGIRGIRVARDAVAADRRGSGLLLLSTVVRPVVWGLAAEAVRGGFRAGAGKADAHTAGIRYCPGR